MKNNENDESTFFIDFYQKYWKNISQVRKFFIFYLLIIFIGAIFLWLPLAQIDGIRTSFLDSVFISASAISDTGLSTVSISANFNWFGQFIILILIEIGGIGFFAIKLFILFYFLKIAKHRRISYTSSQGGQREMIGSDLNQNRGLGIIKVAVIVTVGSTLIFGVLFGILFATITPIPPPGVSVIDPNLVGNWWKALWAGFFHAGASINNSGFDVFAGDSSFTAYYSNYGIQILTIFLFVLGGIGFGIIYDLQNYFRFKSTGQTFKFSLVTKLAFFTYLFVAFFGLSFVFLFEIIELLLHHPASFFLNSDYGSAGDKIMALIFNTLSTRNAGFSTVDITNFSQGSQIIFILSMFIGSGPGSTAGGVRTTTFAVICISLWANLRGDEDTTAFNRKISGRNVRKANVIFLFSILLIGFSTLVISFAELTNSSNVSVFDALFISTSAFGTTGLSTIDLKSISAVSKIMLIIIMLFGKLGMSTTLAQFTRKTPIKIKYIREDVYFG